MNPNNINSPTRQKGAVLLVSMLMLIVLTLIGITGLSNTSLEERMSYNFQQSTLAFQGAESIIQDIMTAGNPEKDENPTYIEADDPMIAAIDAGTEASFAYPATSYSMGTSTVENSATVAYLSTGLCVLASVSSIACYYMEIQADSSIDATNTFTRHIQGIKRSAPGNYTNAIN